MLFKQYAHFYDIFYQRKNYKKECDFLEELFAKYRKGRPKTILDLGCGTGGHMVPLVQRGYSVTGVDASGEMLSLAREKLAKKNLRAEFLKSKVQSFQLASRFDVVTCLFSVIDYVTRSRDLIQTFRNAAAHMGKTSLFIFDFWQAQTVEKYFLSKKKKVFQAGERIVERQSSTTIDRKKNLCEVNYKIRWKENGYPEKKFQEKHVLRYFSIGEMENLLQKSGLNILGLHPFLNIHGTVRSNTWDITIVAQKI